MIKEEFESLYCVLSRSDMRVEGSSNEWPHARSPVTTGYQYIGSELALTVQPTGGSWPLGEVSRDYLGCSLI